jgi:hypothetical protein
MTAESKFAHLRRRMAPNSHLIAASLDLYEALAAIIEALDDGDPTATSARQIASNAGLVAVARAEGRLP